MTHGDAREGEWRGNWWMKSVTSTLTLPRNMLYPALLPLMRTPRLSVVDWTDAPTNLNGLVHFAKREIWFLCVCHHISNAVYLQYWPRINICLSSYHAAQKGVVSFVSSEFLFYFLLFISWQYFFFVVIPHMSDIREAPNVICQEISKVQTYESSEMQHSVPYTVHGKCKSRGAENNSHTETELLYLIILWSDF